MTDLPMLFSAPMILALLAGRKTQTRRVLKPQPQTFITDQGTPCDVGVIHVEGDRRPRVTTGRVITLQEVPYAVSDRLWTRETWQLHGRASDVCTVVYKASINESWTEANEQFPDALAGRMQPRPFQAGWASPIHMPRWASRLTLTVTAVKVERLQDISEEDAEAEGCAPVQVPPDGGSAPHVEGYRDLWNSLHGSDAWAANPWVAALTFTVEQRNIDFGVAA